VVIFRTRIGMTDRPRPTCIIADRYSAILMTLNDLHGRVSCCRRHHDDVVRYGTALAVRPSRLHQPVWAYSTVRIRVRIRVLDY